MQNGKLIALNVEQMEELHKLGVDTSDASLVWETGHDESWDNAELIVKGSRIPENCRLCDAYTLEDIVIKIKSEICYGNTTFQPFKDPEDDENTWYAYGWLNHDIAWSTSPLDAAYNLLMRAAKSGELRAMLLPSFDELIASIDEEFGE